MFRPYSTLLLSDPRGDAAEVRRWVDHHVPEEVTYHHLAHLYSVDRGVYPSLLGVSDDLRVQDAYLRGFDLLVAQVRHAQQHLHTALHPHAAPGDVTVAVRECFWLLGVHARPIATAADRSPQVRAAALEHAVRRAREHVARTPRLYFPQRLSDLSSTQFWAVCAAAGFPGPDRDDVARPGY